ncbi:hypothetical protein ARMGADRAFT_1093292 [Armillaria gallica]|uniref:Uncharacterized protein n=1 Tax=Armillaria gallica TaxID=47427 RepID=A0A2H3C891_ARMGA|nr:hypothetical protein ARMGADRAFT_1093292 [Armillaria gallica]
MTRCTSTFRERKVRILPRDDKHAHLLRRAGHLRCSRQRQDVGCIGAGRKHAREDIDFSDQPVVLGSTLRCCRIPTTSTLQEPDFALRRVSSGCDGRKKGTQGRRKEDDHGCSISFRSACVRPILKSPAMSTSVCRNLFLLQDNESSYCEQGQHRGRLEEGLKGISMIEETPARMSPTLFHWTTPQAQDRMLQRCSSNSSPPSVKQR